MMDLDKKRPYGTVSGPGVAHRYEQDNKKFDGMGKLIPDTEKPTPKRKKGAKK